MPDQVIIVDEKGKRPRFDRKEDLDALGKVLDKIQDVIPYLGAFGYGALAGYHNEKTPEGAVRVGCEALIGLELAKGLPSNSLTPSPTQIFGITLLASIGLSFTATGLGTSMQEFFKNFPWVYPPGSQPPLGGIDITPILKWWEDFRRSLGIPP